MAGNDEVLRIGTEVDLAGAGEINQLADETVSATRRMSQGFEEAGRKGESEFMRARGAAMLLGHEIGVPLNRHLIGFIAQVGAIQGVLSAAFSAVAIIGLIEWVVKLVEHFTASKDAIEVFSKAEKKAYTEAIQDARNLRSEQEGFIKAVYEVAIAQAKTEIEKQKLRIEEATALVKVNANYSGELQRQLGLLDNMAGELREQAKLHRENAEAQMQSMEEGAGFGAGIEETMAQKREQQAEAILQSREYKDLLHSIAEAQNALISAEARQIEQTHKLSKEETTAAQKKFMEQGEQALDRLKMSHELSLNEEASFWLQRLMLAQSAGYPEAVKSIFSKVANIEQGIFKQRNEAIKKFDETLQKQEEEAQKKLLDTVFAKIHEQIVQLQEAHKVMEAEAHRHAEAMKQIEQTVLTDIVRMRGLSVSQEIALERKMHSDEYDMQHAALLKQREAIQADTLLTNAEKVNATAKVNAQLQQLDDLYRKQTIQSDLKALAQRVAMMNQFFDSFNRRFQTAIDGWLEGTETMSQAMRKMFAGMLVDLANFVLQWLLKKFEMWIIEKIFGGQMNALIASTQIAAEAAVAAAAAFADAAMTGPEGLAVAPAAASAAYGTVMAMQALVPRVDVGGRVERSGIAVVHKGETVLTDKLTNMLTNHRMSQDSFHFMPGSVVVQGVSGRLDEASVVKVLKRVARAGALTRV